MTARTNATVRDDLAPLPTIVRPLLAGWWIVLLAALVLGAVGAALTSDGGGGTATARVGLTDEVNWPFYDAARDRLTTQIESDEALAAATEAAGEDVTLRVDQPVNQAFVDVIGESGSPEAAVAGVDAAVAHAVERTREDTARDEQVVVDQLEQEVQVANERLTLLRERIAAQIGAAAEAGGAGEPAAIRARSRQEVLEQERNELVRVRTRTVGELRAARRELAVSEERPDAELLRPAAAEDQDGGLGLATMAAVLGGALLAGVALVALDRRRGRVTHPWYLSGLLGVDVIAHLRDEHGLPRGVRALAHRLGTVGEAEVGIHKVVGTDLAPSAAFLARVVPWIEQSGVRTLVVDRSDLVAAPPGGRRPTETGPRQQPADADAIAEVRDRMHDGTRDLVLIDTASELVSPATHAVTLRLPGTFVLVVAAGERIATVRELLAAAVDVGTPVEGAVLVEPAVLRGFTADGELEPDDEVTSASDLAATPPSEAQTDRADDGDDHDGDDDRDDDEVAPSTGRRVGSVVGGDDAERSDGGLGA